MVWQSEDIYKALGQDSSGESWQGNQIVIDSRLVEQGDIFCALKGENFDGHDFVKDVVSLGCVAVIVERRIDVKVPQVVVEDVLTAIQDLACYRRQQSQAKVVAITGSVGKTTIKDAVQIALGEKESYSSKGNFNNHIGAPLSLANLPLDKKYAVFELGMNHMGEIEFLSKIVRPDIAIITKISDAHIGNFTGLEQIAEAKSEIFLGMKRGGYAILNQDDDFFEFLKERAIDIGLEIKSFGESDDSDIQLNSSIVNDSLVSKVDISLGGISQKINLQIINQELIKVMLSVVVLLDLLQLPQIKNLEKFQLPAGRGKILQLQLEDKKIFVMDDSYNASPTSVKAALEALGKIVISGRKIAVLGEMLELGEESDKLHKGLKNTVVANIDGIVAIGEQMKKLYDILPENKQLIYCDKIEKTSNNLIKELQNNDFLLVKGSRGARTDLIVKNLSDLGNAI